MVPTISDRSDGSSVFESGDTFRVRFHLLNGLHLSTIVNEVLD